MPPVRPSLLPFLLVLVLVLLCGAVTLLRQLYRATFPGARDNVSLDVSATI